MGKRKVKPNYRRRLLRLPDLDHCKRAVLNSLGSPASRRVYEYAIDQFIAWYCSEPRLVFNRIVVVRYRMHLESRGLAANTINQQLAAVRRLAHEAADAGLLSPELAAGISRVKGVKQLGFRAGNLAERRGKLGGVGARRWPFAARQARLRDAGHAWHRCGNLPQTTCLFWQLFETRLREYSHHYLWPVKQLSPLERPTAHHRHWRELFVTHLSVLLVFQTSPSRLFIPGGSHLSPLGQTSPIIQQSWLSFGG